VSSRYVLETMSGKRVVEFSGCTLERAKALGKKLAGDRRMRLRVISEKPTKKAPGRGTRRKVRRSARNRRARRSSKNRRRNPGVAPSTPQLARAGRTFEMWHGFSPRNVVRARIRRVPEILVNLGTVRAIEYESNKWTGRKTRYRHVFNEERPLLCTGPTGKEGLFFQGGGYKVTDRGLED